jgi:hypothetical protein
MSSAGVMGYSLDNEPVSMRTEGRDFMLSTLRRLGVVK